MSLFSPLVRINKATKNATNLTAVAFDVMRSAVKDLNEDRQYFDTRGKAFAKETVGGVKSNVNNTNKFAQEVVGWTAERAGAAADLGGRVVDHYADQTTEKAGAAANLAGKTAGWISDTAKGTVHAAIQGAAAVAETTGAVRTTQAIARRSRRVRNQGVAQLSQLTDPELRSVADKTFKAIGDAVDLWKAMAGFRNIAIMGPSAIGQPGCLDGPNLEPLIVSSPSVASLSGSEEAISDAIATAFADCFALWESGTTVPGLPWYPAFAAFPGPVAPRMPNVPTSLITCVSTNSSKLASPYGLSEAIRENLPDDLKHLTTFSNAVATSLSAGFMMWQTSAQVMNVLGGGPVPTFAPPYVPVGPVVNGNVLATPGHLSNAPRMSLIVPPGF